MIDKRFEKVIQKIKSVHLTHEEKNEVLDRILLVVDKIEAVSIATPTFKRPVKSPFVGTIISYIEYKKFVPAFAIAAFLLLSGGVSLAAEQALPGDSLFNLKRVNEQVLGFAAVSSEAKARLALEVSERRLQEAATLSVQGKLTTERKAIIQTEFKKQAAEVKNQVASLVSQNNITAAQEIALDFEASLKAHEDLISKVATVSTGEDVAIAATSSEAVEVSSLLATIKDELATSTVARVDLESKEIALAGNNASKAEMRLKEVSDKVRSVKDMKAKSILPPLFNTSNTVDSLNGKIAASDSAILKAKAYITAKQYNDALIVIQQADRSISDAQSLLETSQKSDLAVKKAVETALTAAVAPTSTPATTTTPTTPDISATTTTSVTVPDITGAATTTLGL